MLNTIAKSFEVLAKQPGAASADIDQLQQAFEGMPQEYLLLIIESTEIELVEHIHNQYIRIWGPLGCINMNEGYDIRNRMPEAIPIGDDGGGHVIFYFNGKKGFGLYHVGFGNLDGDDAVWICGSLTEFLTTATGIESF